MQKVNKKEDSSKILSDIEELNVDVPMNRDKFRKFYLTDLHKYSRKEDLFIDPEEEEGEAKENY